MSTSTTTHTHTRSTPGNVALDDRTWGAEALQAVWERQRGLVDERVALIEEAVAALGQARLHAQSRENARRAAHMLAGSLGMFGFADASSAAASLQDTLENATDADADELNEFVLRLRDGTRDSVHL